LLADADCSTGAALQVLAASQLYAVTLDDNPINARVINVAYYAASKYKRTLYSSVG
jgi:hypothetical protein